MMEFSPTWQSEYLPQWITSLSTDYCDILFYRTLYVLTDNKIFHTFEVLSASFCFIKYLKVSFKKRIYKHLEKMTLWLIEYLMHSSKIPGRCPFLLRYTCIKYAMNHYRQYWLPAVTGGDSTLEFEKSEVFTDSIQMSYVLSDPGYVLSFCHLE